MAASLGAELIGEVAGVLYSDTATGFGVVEVDRDDAAGGARCVGPLSDLVAGQTVRLVGSWTEHPRYGPTFEAVLYEQVTPATAAGVRSFLQSERFDAVERRHIERVMTIFGAAAGTVIEHEPKRLVSEAGLPQAVADDLHGRWREGQALAALVRLVEPAAMPYDVIRAVHARFKDQAIEVARTDPYLLLEVERCRFAHADALARTLGVAPADPRRLAAGAAAAVTALRRREGHQHAPRSRCVQDAARLLGVDAAAAAAGVDGAVAAGALMETSVEVAGEPLAVVTPPAALRTEQRLAEGLLRLGAATSSRLTGQGSKLRVADELTAGQRQAVRMVFESPVALLTGGPGTGKTRTVEEVVRAAEGAEANVALCAPTGRAAKRLEEVVGRAATTVHRLLEARPLSGGGFVFRYGEDDPLPHDLIICDEVSMCDTWLAGALVAAVDDGVHLLLVGDPDQLPSVGPGDVLADLLRSAVIPHVELTEVHRQAAGSRIVGLAHEINSGDVGSLAPIDGDVFLAEEPRRTAIVPRVVAAVADRIPAYFGVRPDDIQVVAPVYRGPCGVDALNAGLREALNPPADRPAVGGLRAGDRVMQTRNDAERDVSNGDIGTVVDADVRRRALRVAFPRGEVRYDRDQMRDLVPAWAVTVHKSQGGEWPVVVLVVDASHRAMLWRNLVYTAVTRARDALVVVGQAAALRSAAEHDVPRNRVTGLAGRLAHPAATT